MLHYNLSEKILMANNFEDIGARTHCAHALPQMYAQAGDEHFAEKFNVR